MISRSCLVSTRAAGVALLALVASGDAWAGPHAEVASAFDSGDGFDLHVTLDYGLELARAKVQREAPAGADTDPIPFEDELGFQGARHLVTPRLELGVFTDLSITVALPIVIADSRSLSLERDAATTLRDAILPSEGVDVDGGPIGGGDDIFRGPTRSGLDQVHLGLVWAPMNQLRDDTKPTWKIGGEVRLSVGEIAAYDRADPGSETGVSSGVTEARVWTSFSRRLGWAEPYVAVWWQAPLSTKEASPFADLGFGQLRGAKQQQAGTQFGFEAIAWENAADRQRVGIELSARLEGLFEGRAHTPMWEAFAFAGAAGAGGPLVLDRDPTQMGVQELSHPGVTNVENYLRLGGRVAVRAELGDRVRFGAGFELTSIQDHVISFADAGVDRPTCEPGQTSGCEADNDILVDPDTEEVNPGHVRTIDQIGGRYFLAGATDYALTVEARVLF